MSRPPLGSTLDIFGRSIPWYSLLIMVAFVVGIILATKEEKRLRLPADTVLNFALLAIPLAIIGARLYYVAFSWQRFASDPLEIFRIWNGGLAFYGGLIGGLLAAFLITVRMKVPFWKLLDAIAPSVALGQAIGRWGNYANMEAYGARIYNEAAQFFPIAVEIKLVGANGMEYWYWHMATFFYESVACFIFFCILMALRKKMTRQGDVSLWYLLFYCAARAVIEGLRDDSLMLNVAAAQVRISQIVSALVCVGVIVVFFLRLKRARKLHLSDRMCWVVVGVSLACTFVGEFERNAYQMLFIPAQILLLALLGLDIYFFIHYFKRARVFNATSVWMLVCIVLSVGTLALGIGRLGASNTAYIALRQSVAMLQVVLSGAWFYLRMGAAKKVEAAPTRPPEGGEPWYSVTVKTFP